MSERDNALAQGTLVPYTEAHRDRVEAELTKRELIVERRGGLEIIVWWLSKTNEISLQLIDEGKNETLEAIIPSDSVLKAVAQPYPALGDQGVYPSRGIHG